MSFIFSLNQSGDQNQKNIKLTFQKKHITFCFCFINSFSIIFRIIPFLSYVIYVAYYWLSYRCWFDDISSVAPQHENNGQVVRVAYWYLGAVITTIHHPELLSLIRRV